MGGQPATGRPGVDARHGGGHSHATSRSARLLVALAINLVLVVGQVVAGLVAHSTSLLADAGHNVTDIVAVVVSLAAVRWALRPRSDARSFGNHRGTILAALANAATLAVVTVAIVAESIYRLVHPAEVEGGIVVAVAAAAIVANGVAALVVRDGSHDLNMRATFVHMASDVAASFVVLLAGAVILATGGGGWDRLDPAASLVVAVLITVEAVRLVKESADVLLESTPPDIDLVDLRRAITGVAGVGEVHDLHVWSLSSDFRALSAHLVLTGHPTLEQAQEVGGRVKAEVSGPFDIAHTTFELECERCADSDDPCGVDDAPAAVQVHAD
ncbi:MAG TPA: cation diffusion facilitator family transporter [Acidimicrobiales bacterium]|nr:cation diffusion facilitator family transporter [Acidimicrobiales bacterium]